jgi:lysophospholipid acyltransferase
MVLTMKLITFAWNVYDGRQTAQVAVCASELEARLIFAAEPGQVAVGAPSHSNALAAGLPWLCVSDDPPAVALILICIRLYFPGILIGPSLEFANYNALVNASAFKEEQKSTGRRMPPGRKRVAYWRALQGIAFLGLFVLYGGQYDFTYMLERAWFARTWWNK